MQSPDMNFHFRKHCQVILAALVLCLTSLLGNADHGLEEKQSYTIAVTEKGARLLMPAAVKAEPEKVRIKHDLNRPVEARGSRKDRSFNPLGDRHISWTPNSNLSKREQRKRDKAEAVGKEKPLIDADLVGLVDKNSRIRTSHVEEAVATIAQSAPSEWRGKTSLPNRRYRIPAAKGPDTGTQVNA